MGAQLNELVKLIHWVNYGYGSVLECSLLQPLAQTNNNKPPLKTKKQVIELYI